MIRDHSTPVDVLFVNPPSPDGVVYIRDINRHGRSSWERIIWPQTSLAYLAAIGETLALSVDIVDCIAEDISWSTFEAILRRCRPRYCVSNIISVTYSNDLRTLDLAKDVSGARTIGLGPHLTAAPEHSLRESDSIDFIILHEAEETLKELLEVYEKKVPPTAERLSQVKGIAFNTGTVLPGNGSEIVITEQRPFIRDLDSLPRPRHDLLPLDRYWAPFLGNYTFVEASRGCAYRCVFCRQAVMWQWKFRSRSAKAIAEEAIYVQSLGVDNILFHADTFTLDQRIVEELCDILIAAGSPFRWACNTHVLNLYSSEELVRKMRVAGCWMIAIGIESGDDQVLKNIKKQITVEKAESVVRMIDEAGIEPWGYFIVGLPGDTLETINKTIDFALRLPLRIAKFDVATPYPGTEFHRYAKEHGYLKVDKYEEFDQNASAVVEYPELSRAQIKAAVRRANRRFFMRPRILLRTLCKASDLTTVKTLFRITWDQFRLLSGVTRARRDATVRILDERTNDVCPPP